MTDKIFLGLMVDQNIDCAISLESGLEFLKHETLALIIDLGNLPL